MADNASVSSSQGSSNHDEEDAQEVPVYTTAEEAEVARHVSLELYNKGLFQEALPLQVGVLKYITSKHGETAAECGLAYLDYGLTLLAIIQGQDAEAAMIAGEANDDDLELCFVNLDAARVCFEKAEAKAPSDELVQLRLAEVHDALAQLLLEQDNTEGAIGEFENVLLILRNNLSSDADPKKHKKIVGTLFSIGNALLGEQDYEGAVKRLEETLAAINAAPSGAIDAQLKTEVESILAEARELQSKPEEMDAIREEIRELFPDEKSQIPDPEEFEKQQKPANEFIVPMPVEFAGASRSVPLSLMTPIAPEDGHSNSISMFPRQVLHSGESSQHRGVGAGASAPSSGAINVNVPIKKKEKPTAAVTMPPPSGSPAKAERSSQGTSALPEKRVRLE